VWLAWSPIMGEGVVVRPDQVSWGVLVSAVPRDAVDDAVVACGVGDKRLGGKLPAHVTAYLTMALCLFADDDYAEVATKVTGSLSRWGCWNAGWSVPTTGGITQACKRLGPKVLAELRRGTPARRPQRGVHPEDHRHRTCPGDRPLPTPSVHPKGTGRTVRGHPTHPRRRRQPGPPAASQSCNDAGAPGQAAPGPPVQAQIARSARRGQHRATTSIRSVLDVERLNVRRRGMESNVVRTQVERCRQSHLKV
jgi:transposase IS4-like protein